MFHEFFEIVYEILTYIGLGFIFLILIGFIIGGLNK
jgi:hypothetical protein